MPLGAFNSKTLPRIELHAYLSVVCDLPLACQDDYVRSYVPPTASRAYHLETLPL